MLRGKRVEIEPDGGGVPLELWASGERVGQLPGSIEAVPRALRVLVPDALVGVARLTRRAGAALGYSTTSVAACRPRRARARCRRCCTCPLELDLAGVVGRHLEQEAGELGLLEHERVRAALSR